MAAFTTEALVRERFQLGDAARVPSELIEQVIEEAHGEVLRRLDPDAEIDPPDKGLVAGETLLAGARLYGALAAKDAFDVKQVSLGSNVVSDGNRFQALMTMAAWLEDQAWYLLEPAGAERPARAVADVTDTQSVLREA